MAKAIIMPKFGFTQESAEIVRWIKREGESVESGDPIAEVTTDKVNMEVEATASGILAGLKYKEGDTVPVTEIIAYILDKGESLPTDEGAAPPPQEQPAPQPESKPTEVAKEGRIRATPVAEQYAREKGLELSQISGSGPGGRVMRGDIDNYLQVSQEEQTKQRVTPGARRIARELGVDLQHVSGTGPRNRVQGEDVRQYAAGQTTPAPPPQPTAQPLPTQPPADEKVIPFNAVRRLIAERMQRSAQEAPHIYFDADVDASALEALRKRGNANLPEGQATISLTVLLLRGVAWTLQRHPLMNSQLEKDSIRLLPGIHIGVAVAAETGLIVPVLRDVPQKSAGQLAAELNDLVKRARENRLRPDDVTGGTFTISNLGMFGVDRFTAIINPPQASILSVGRVRKMFVPDENDLPVVRPIMTITLGADHRVVDGAIAARFLTDLREVLEHPEMMIL